MGTIIIQVYGSFKTHRHGQFSALHGGHAEAVAEAIEWLAKEILPEAIEQDHQLQKEGALPKEGVGKRKPCSAAR